jgi:hypothetical protein
MDMILLILLTGTHEFNHHDVLYMFIGTPDYCAEVNCKVEQHRSPLDETSVWCGTTCNKSIELNNLVTSHLHLVNKLGTSSANTSC